MSKPAARHWALFIAMLLMGFLYGAGWVATGVWMPANARIGGVAVGSMTPVDAARTLRTTLAPRADNDVVLMHEKERFALDPDELGLSLDVARSVMAAGGTRSLNPLDMAGLLVGEHDSDPVIRSDEQALKDAVDRIAKALDRKVVEAQISFPDGKPVAREPVAGLVVRKRATARAITQAYLVAKAPAPVPTSRIEPAVDQAGLDLAMEDIGKPAVSAPVILRSGDKRYELPVSAFAPALVVRVNDGALRPYLDPEALAKPLTDSATGIGQKAVNARIDIVDGKPKIYPGKPGVGLQPKEMARKLLPVLTRSGNKRSLTINTDVVEPEFTTEEAEGLNIKEKMGEFTTHFPHADYRNINQRRAAELIDGTLLQPGETFSLNSIVGRRTKENGFVKGFVISGGVFREEQGGGVSQVATTAYNAAFFAGLEDVEHHPHQFYIDRYPVGREATVYYGQLDLRFRNDTDDGVLVKASLTPSTPSSQGHMHVELWGTKVWDIEAGLSARRDFTKPKKRHDDSDECVPSEPARGFRVDVHRYFERDGKRVKTETDHVRYSPTPEVICDDDDD